MEDNKVFHIYVKLLNGKTKTLIENSPNLSVWEISNLEKMSATRQLGICFNGVDTIIETMQYCYDNMIDLCLVHMDKMKFKKSKGGSTTSVENRNDRFYL